MNVMDVKPETALLDAARALRPLVEASADQIEHDRQLPESLVEAMAAAGLLTMLVPRELGGTQVDPVTCARVTEEIARGDGSAAWCLNTGAVIGVAAASLRASAASLIWGHNRRAYVAGSAVGQGTAVVAGGGFRVSGRWSFTSGCQHATWLLGVADVRDGNTSRPGPNGQPESRLVFFQKADCRIIDTWDVAGLRGTGSHDFVVEDVFVPEERTHPRSYAAPPLHPAPLYAFAAGSVVGANAASAGSSPWVGLSSSGMAAVTLGIARGALDAFVELAAVKTPTRRSLLLRDDPIVQDQFGRAEAKLRAARVFFYETISDVWRLVQETGTGTAHGQVMIRLASVHAAETAAEVVDTVWKAAGTSAIVNGSRLDRRLRDVQVAGQNVSISPMHIGTAGRMLLGSGR